jgi:adenylate kinase
MGARRAFSTGAAPQGGVNPAGIAFGAVGVAAAAYFANEASSQATEAAAAQKEAAAAKKTLNQFESYWPRKIMILFGAPGAGKGTQAPKIVDTLNIPQLSTGDIMRGVDKSSPLGKEMGKYMSAGKLVPDKIVVDIVVERINQGDCKNGFILDGFPRTKAQAVALDKQLAANGERVSNIIAFNVPDSVLEERVCGRWIHKKSGRSYHVKFAAPKAMKLGADGKPIPETMLDDSTGEALYQRADDTAAALKTRLKSYHKETVPILGHYAPAGLVKNVNANQDIAKVWGEVEQGLHSK